MSTNAQAAADRAARLGKIQEEHLKLQNTHQAIETYAVSLEQVVEAMNGNIYGQTSSNVISLSGHYKVIDELQVQI